MKPFIILDESCASLEGAVAAFAPVFVFTRKKGFLTPTREAVVELERCLSGTSRPSPPYILVSASFAGFTAIMYASRHANMVGGLVLVDSSHPRLGEVSLGLLPACADDESEALREFRRYLGGFGPAWEVSRRQVARIKTLGDIPMIVLAAGKLEMPDELDPVSRQALQRACLTYRQSMRRCLPAGGSR